MRATSRVSSGWLLGADWNGARENCREEKEPPRTFTGTRVAEASADFDKLLKKSENTDPNIARFSPRGMSTMDNLRTSKSMTNGNEPREGTGASVGGGASGQGLRKPGRRGTAPRPSAGTCGADGSAAAGWPRVDSLVCVLVSSVKNKSLKSKK